jgi:hypothetical protein
MFLSTIIRIWCWKIQSYMFLFALILPPVRTIACNSTVCSPSICFPFPTFHFRWFLILPVQNSSTKFYLFHTRTHTHTHTHTHLSSFLRHRGQRMFNLARLPKTSLPCLLPTIVSWGLSSSRAESSTRCSVIKYHRLPTTWRLYIKYRSLLQPSYKYYIEQGSV